MKSLVCYPCPADTPRSDPPSTMAPRVDHGQAGVALITVLLIVFLASVTATSLAALQQIAIRRSTVLQHQQQARLYTLGAEQWAMLALARDRKQNETDHPGEAWANPPSSALSIQGGVLAITMRDLQGCFNLNNLWQPASTTSSDTTDPKKQPEKDGKSANQGQDQDQDQDQADDQPADSKSPPATPKPANTTGTRDSNESTKSGKARLNETQFRVLQRLLTGLELKPELAQAIVDWIDPDQDPLFPDGAEDSDYSVRTPSYLAANRFLYSVTELRLIKGVDSEVYDKLAPLVCVLPSNTPLNVNTAPVRVLAALANDQDPKDLEHLLEDRPDDGYKTVDDFLSAAKLTVDASLKAQLSVDSQHFLLRAEARVGDGHAMLYSILYREEDGIRVLRRSFGNQD